MVMSGRCLHFMGLYPILGCHDTQNVLHKYNHLTKPIRIVCMNRKDRTLNGGGVMLLVHKDIPHMPLAELDNDSKSVWVKPFANKTTRFVASWYRPPVDGQLPVSDNGNDLLNSQEKFDNLFRGTGRQRSGKGAIRNRFPLQKSRWEKPNKQPGTYTMKTYR